MSATPDFDAKRPLLAKRLRDIGLLVAIAIAMGAGLLQLYAAMPDKVETVAVTTLAASQHRTAVGSVQTVARARLADGSEVDVLLPAEAEVKAGQTLEVDKLVMRDGSVHYRAATSVRTGR